MIDLSPSPEYRLASSLIAALAADPRIAPIVIDRPLDTRDQVDRITVAAAHYQGAVAVMADGVRAPWSGDINSPGRTPLEVDLAVLIIVSPDIQDITADDYSRRIRARVIALAQQWSGDATGIPYTSPRITGLDDVAVDIPGLGEMLVRSVTVSCRTQYTLHNT